MILGEIPIPKKIVIPEEVILDSRHCDVNPRTINPMPFGADCWIGLKQAMPHRDDHYWNSFFLTLSIKSRHEAGDALTHEPANQIPRGTLFVIDPRTAHWLHAMSNQENSRLFPWIGLQWEVPRRSAKARARSIIESNGGRWHRIDDRRYRSWRPEV